MISCGPVISPGSACADAGRVGRGAADGGSECKQQRHDRCGLRGGNLLAQAREMTAGDVASLVREHADDLVWRVRFVERADVDEDAPSIGHERIERAVTD